MLGLSYASSLSHKLESELATLFTPPRVGHPGDGDTWNSMWSVKADIKGIPRSCCYILVHGTQHTVLPLLDFCGGWVRLLKNSGEKRGRGVRDANASDDGTSYMANKWEHDLWFVYSTLLNRKTWLLNEIGDSDRHVQGSWVTTLMLTRRGVE